MYNINIRMIVRIKGCPLEGAPAELFREHHGIKPFASNMVYIAWNNKNNAEICQALPELLNRRKNITNKSMRANLNLTPALMGMVYLYNKGKKYDLAVPGGLILDPEHLARVVGVNKSSDIKDYIEFFKHVTDMVALHCLTTKVY